MKAKLYVYLDDNNSLDQQNNASAIQVMRELVQEYGVDSFDLDIVNIAAEPEVAESEGIHATPCLIFVDGARLFVPIIGDFKKQRAEIASCLELTTR